MTEDWASPEQRSALDSATHQQRDLLQLQKAAYLQLEAIRLRLLQEHGHALAVFLRDKAALVVGSPITKFHWHFFFFSDDYLSISLPDAKVINTRHPAYPVLVAAFSYLREDILNVFGNNGVVLSFEGDTIKIVLELDDDQWETITLSPYQKESDPGA